MFTCRLPWWTSSAACKLWQPPHFLPGVWEKCQLPSCKGINTTVGQGQQVDAQEKQVLEDLEMPLAKRDMETLFQEQPETGNQYLEDALLRSYLKTHLPPKKKLELASSTMKLEPAVKQMRDAISSLVQFTRAAGSKGAATMELAARDFSYTLARTYAGALLIEHAARPDASSTDISAARRWCNQELCPVATELENSSYEAEEALMDHALVYEGSPTGRSRL